MYATLASLENRITFATRSDHVYDAALTMVSNIAWVAARSARRGRVWCSWFRRRAPS
jgi:hypothetical protein